MHDPDDPLALLVPADLATPELPELGAATVELVDPRTFARRALAQRLPAESAWYLAAWMEPVRVAAGTPLFVFGESSDALYLLCAGELEARLPMDGEDLRLGTVSPGQWLGEINLLDAGPVSATVEATTQCLLMRLSHGHMERIRADDPAIASDLGRVLLEDLAARIRRCSAGLITRDADGSRGLTAPDLDAADLLVGLARGVA